MDRFRASIFIAVAFMVGLELGFIHGRAGVVNMADDWLSASRHYAELHELDRPQDDPTWILLNRCGGDAMKLGRGW